MRILFVCVENAGRSQIAEAFAKRLAPPGVEVYSAGSMPAKAIHPEVVEAMREVGVELSTQAPKGLSALPAVRFDVVVGMGCGEACPLPAAIRRVEWNIPNPKGQPLPAVRAIRDEIQAKVQALLDELGLRRTAGS